MPMNAFRTFITGIMAALGIAAAIPARAATTLLPNGEQCFQATTGLNGMVGLLGTITGGSSYTAGTYAGVALTGGSGTGATASIVISGGAVTSVVIQAPGVNYVVGDVLSATAASIGGTGAGFSVPVSSIAVNSSLAGGTVNMFVPNTTNPKTTWKDPNQVTANAVPITLDANGCAIIYGTGSYRQQVLDSLGNLIYDQLTTDTSSQQAPFWAGNAGGTANVITITDAGFNATDGSVIGFTAIATNTAGTTINPSGFGAITVLKDTTGGPVALVGGEIVQNNPIWVAYRASDNAFHLTNPVIQSASGATSPLCGAVGLKITNNSGTPNTIVTVTATQVVAQTPAGLVINRSNITLNINLTTGTSTSAANGMDGEAVGTSRWLDIWVIDNGAAAAGLASVHSGNGLTPTMPSTYVYKCRLGAMSVDGSGNLFRTTQLGAVGQYVNGAGNTTVSCHVTDGIQGSTYSDSSPTLVAITVAGDSFCAPATATAVNLMSNAQWKNNGPHNLVAAPNISWGGANNGPIGTNGQVYPIFSRGTNVTSGAWMNLEATTIGYAASGIGAAINLLNWRDNVNAN